MPAASGQCTPVPQQQRLCPCATPACAEERSHPRGPGSGVLIGYLWQHGQTSLERRFPSRKHRNDETPSRGVWLSFHSPHSSDGANILLPACHVYSYRATNIKTLQNLHYRITIQGTKAACHRSGHAKQRLMVRPSTK